MTVERGGPPSAMRAKNTMKASALQTTPSTPTAHHVDADTAARSAGLVTNAGTRDANAVTPIATADTPSDGSPASRWSATIGPIAYPAAASSTATMAIQL